MERIQDNEFREWFSTMIKKYGLSKRKLERTIGLSTNLIHKILSGKHKTTNGIKYLIINFFEKEYGEIYDRIEKIEPITFGEWLNDVMYKYRISENKIADELTSRKVFISVSSIGTLRRGTTGLDIWQREAILDLLEKNYKIDISKGKELINSTENMYYKAIGEWLCQTMKTIGINDYELSQCIDLSKSTIFCMKQGNFLLRYERMEKIFVLFEEYGINTTDGRKKYEEALEYKKMHRD